MKHFLVDILLLILAILAFAIVQNVLGHHDWPDLEELPMFIAPAITFGMVFTTCFGFIFKLIGDNISAEGMAAKRERIVVINALTILITLGICHYLVRRQEKAVVHIVLTLILFAVFIIWDVLMYKNTDKPAIKEEIKRASILINQPTLCALALILIYITAFDHNSDTDKKKELLVSGAIAFHLSFAAFAFLLATHSNVVKDMLKFLWNLLPKALVFFRRKNTSIQTASRQ